MAGTNFPYFNQNQQNLGTTSLTNVLQQTPVTPATSAPQQSVGTTPVAATPTVTTPAPATTTSPYGSSGETVTYNPYEQKMQDYTRVLDSLGLLADQDRAVWEQWKNRNLKDPQSVILAMNAWNEYKAQLNEIAPDLKAAGIDIIFDEAGHTTRFRMPDGRLSTVSEGLGWFSSEIDRLTGEAATYGESDRVFQQLQDYLLDFGGESGVDPFQDLNGWNEAIKSAFGELGGSQDPMLLLQSLYNMMPMSDYSADALPNLTLEQRTTKFFDDLRASGFSIDPEGGGLDQQLRDFLYNKVMEMNNRTFAQFDVSRSDWDRMSAMEMSELTKILGRNSVLEDKEMRQYMKAKLTDIRTRNREEYKQMLGKLGMANATYGGAAIRSAQELAVRMTEQEMSTQADVLMHSIELAEQGKMTALQQLGQLTQAQADFLINLGGLQNTAAGQMLDFAVGIANVSASEYSTKTEQQMAVADLELKASLGIAGLEMDQYKTDSGLDMEKLRLDYENYWKDRGYTFEEKKQEFQDAIVKWETSSMMTDMINSGRTERLVQMIDLAIKARAGDMEAQQMYQQLALTERLENRGYDINQASILADLQWNIYNLQQTFDFQRWAINNQALLERELAKLNADTQLAIAQIQADAADGGFWSDMADLVGGVVPLGSELKNLFKKKSSGKNVQQ